MAGGINCVNRSRKPKAPTPRQRSLDSKYAPGMARRSVNATQTPEAVAECKSHEPSGVCLNTLVKELRCKPRGNREGGHVTAYCDGWIAVRTIQYTGNRTTTHTTTITT
jgi:hypothetical protein